MKMFKSFSLSCEKAEKNEFHTVFMVLSIMFQFGQMCSFFFLIAYARNCREVPGRRRFNETFLE